MLKNIGILLECKNELNSKKEQWWNNEVAENIYKYKSLFRKNLENLFSSYKI